VTNEAGLELEGKAYVPYGLTRGAEDISGVGYQFTDQERDTSTGLYNYDARLYDPVIGRFLSADSIVPNFHSPQSLNRYAYCVNNPLIYVDPSGHANVEYGLDENGESYGGFGGLGIGNPGTYDPSGVPATSVQKYAIAYCTHKL
jgi:RHS repeat-associated protein